MALHCLYHWETTLIAVNILTEKEVVAGFVLVAEPSLLSE